MRETSPSCRPLKFDAAPIWIMLFSSSSSLSTSSLSSMRSQIGKEIELGDDNDLTAGKFESVHIGFFEFIHVDIDYYKAK